MSRNKQVDRLRDGLKGNDAPGVDEDPVSHALRVINEYKEELFTLSQNRIEDKKFFKALHYEMVHAGFNEQLVINRPGKTPVSLATLGFNRLYPKIDTAEDRDRLIAIIGMVIVSMRNQILDERQVSDKDLNNLTKKLESTRENHKNVVEWNNSVIKDLKAVVQLRNDEINRSCVVIKDMTEELKYQVAATKQYKRELDTLRLDIIDREILREEFHN